MIMESLLISKRNKRGWIRIVEAFIAILFIIGALLMVVNKGYFGKSNEEKVYQIQAEILREIQLNDEFRKEVLIADDDTTLTNDLANGIESHNGEIPNLADLSDGKDSTEGGKFPKAVWDMIEKRISEFNLLECRAKICDLDLACGLNEYPDKNVYAQPVSISTSNTQNLGPDIQPRQLKLFCWTK
ncbi:hypothetical protein COU57_07030 [Candidatus Pacearchaeota archaeon CG10_big_fil_rev_8_21_14_0_10_32_14]|nr:MAG: hypothetical protein COU57_07030 [Candidatus Pacearchaeota archaeon CG10_big_fil_rev_8_21_14_0_10_32_14]